MSGAAGIPTITAGRRSTTATAPATDSQGIDLPEVLAWIHSFLD